MRALILSDIHANLDALDAVLAAAPQHDTVWNLGDTVGYGANPNEVIERVKSLGEVSVRGNHDRVCCGLDSLLDFNPIAAQAARWTRTALTPEHVEWLSLLSEGPVMCDGPEVSCVHGSVLDEDQYVMTLRDAWLPLQEGSKPASPSSGTRMCRAALRPMRRNGSSWNRGTTAAASRKSTSFLSGKGFVIC